VLHISCFAKQLINSLIDPGTIIILDTIPLSLLINFKILVTFLHDCCYDVVDDGDWSSVNYYYTTLDTVTSESIKSGLTYTFTL
jgi:hypothetical protein